MEIDMGPSVGTPHVAGQIEAAFSQQSRLATAILQNMPVVGFLLDEEGVFVESVADQPIDHRGPRRADLG